MSTESQITLAQIRARANKNSFTRGEQYFRQNAISDTVKRGNVIEGFCAGSESQPYHVQVTLDKTGILETSCTCHYSYEGDCKHIVALLLTYLNRPEDFEERPTIEDALQKRTKEELIKLIQTMVRHYPDLQALVDRPIPGPDTYLTPVNTAPFRKELRRTFENFGDYYDDYNTPMPADAVFSVAKSAEDFIELNDWRSASAIYQAILEEFLDGNHEYLLDDEGELISALNLAVEKLAACLAQSQILDSDTERRAIFTMLMRAFIWDTNFGGIGLADDAPDIVYKYAKPADIPIIRDQLLAAQASHIARPYSNWGQEVYSNVLMELDTLNHVDPEVILERLRQNGQYYLLVTKLLDLKRLDEALEIIKSHIQGNVDQPRVLYDLQQKGYETAAIQQAEAWLKAGYNDFIAGWLIGRLTINHDHERNLKWQLVRMNEKPDIRYYVELKVTAQEVGNWDIVRPELLKKFERLGHYDILTRAYLHDEDWDKAWATLPKTQSKSPTFAYAWTSLELEVANQSYLARPEKALPVYQKYVRIRINERNRQSYAEAAALLKTVREIFNLLDDIAGWKQYINDLRTEFKKLPAFQDELSKAKL